MEKNTPDRSDSRANRKKHDKKKSTIYSAVSSISSEAPSIRAEPSNSRSVGRGKKRDRANHMKRAAKGPLFRFVMPKPDCIVLDLLGTIVTKKFMSTSKDIRIFAKKHLTDYLEENWRKKPLRVILNFFRGSQHTCPESLRLGRHDLSKEEQVEQARRHILYRMKTQPDSPAVGIFMLGITEWGYGHKLLVTPVYDEVHETLKHWTEVHKLPIYVGVGSADFLLMVLTTTTSGNLIPFFKGHMNLTDFDGNKVNKDFKKLITLVKFPPNKILYLTRFRSDARKAIESGIMSMIVLRQDFDSNNIVSAAHKWRAKNPNATTSNRHHPSHSKSNSAAAAASNIAGPGKVATKEPPEEKSFIKKLGTALGLEAIMGGGPTWETQRNILINASEDMDPSKLRSPNEEQSMHHRSSQLLEEDLDYYKIILSLDEIEFS